MVVPGTGYGMAYIHQDRCGKTAADMRKKMYGYYLYFIAWLSFLGSATTPWWCLHQGLGSSRGNMRRRMKETGTKR